VSAGDRDGGRARRIGLNEGVFREVNERLRDLADELVAAGTALDLICECGNASCAERIAMPAAEYEALRGDPLLFAVVPGHDLPDVEEVEERRGGYDVVRKHGVPARVAEETDPRTHGGG
jgi:hypothetical protein